MADEEDQGSTSPTGYGLAQNPLMPMGDPLAYARTTAAPEASVPRIGTEGAKPPDIMRPTPVNIPPPSQRGGGGPAPNQLQPDQGQTPADPNLNSLQNLLQMKEMTDLAGISGASVPVPASAGTGTGAGRGPGRGTSRVSSTYAGPYQDMVNEAAAKYNVDPKMLTSQLFHESAYDPKAVSSAGAQGLGQFMPETAKLYKVNVNDPKSSIDGAAHYFSDMRKMFNGSDQLGLAAYNWGPGNVHKWLKAGADPDKMPEETRDYVMNITGKPLAPNITPQTADLRSAGATPQSVMELNPGGGFVIPPAPKTDATHIPIGGGEGNKMEGPTGDKGEGPTGDKGEKTPIQAPSGSDQMQKLWKYMMIKSLFPQLQFRNVGYDPWAVHRFGQGGGY